MNPEKFRSIVTEILQKDRRYKEEAYYFINEAVAYASELYQKPRFGKKRHLSIDELCEAICEFSLNEFGAMAFTVLQIWGLETTLDFGHVVFNLIDANVLAASDNDKLGDFDEIFTLDERLRQPFHPKNTQIQAPKSIDLL